MWFTDPTTGGKSVSLTLMMASFTILVGVGLAQSLEKLQSIGPFLELFFTTTALYFGRRISYKGVGYGAEDPKKDSESNSKSA